MVNLARFTIGSSPSSDRGFDVNPGDVPVLRLEASSTLVKRTTFEVHSAAAGAPRSTSGAPTLTLNNGSTTGQSIDAITPGAAVSISSGIPSARAAHVWEVRCLVNGGVNPDGSVNPDYVFSRFVAMRSIRGSRKIIASERNEYDPIDAWASAINDLVDSEAAANDRNAVTYNAVSGDNFLSPHGPTDYVVTNNVPGPLVDLNINTTYLVAGDTISVRVIAAQGSTTYISQTGETSDLYAITGLAVAADMTFWLRFDGTYLQRQTSVANVSVDGRPVQRILLDSSIAVAHNGPNIDKLVTLSVSDSVVPKWRRHVDVDFSALANQSITANGAVTLGGTTFQIENIGSLYPGYTAVFGAVNGAGFRTPSNASGSVLTGKTARTLPMIGWSLPLNVKANVGVRAVVQFANSSSTSAANIMLEYGSATPLVANKYNLVAFGASGIISASGCQIGRTLSTDSFVAYSTDGTADIAGFTTGTDGSPLSNGFTSLFDVSSTANLNDLDTIPRVYRDNGSMTGAVPLATVGRMSNWRVAISFGQTTPAVGTYATIRRLIIELFY